MEEVINFASDEERYFYWWCQELKDKGFIDKIEFEPEKFTLSDGLVLPVVKKLKTKEVVSNERVLHKQEYTPDFKITWNQKAENIFFKKATTRGNRYSDYGLINDNPINNTFVTWIEVKPTFDQNNMTRLVTINIKTMWQLYSIYINTVKIGIQKNSFFDKTFTPTRFLFTNKTKKPRNFKYRPITLNQYLEKIRLLNITRGIYGTTIELF